MCIWLKRIILLSDRSMPQASIFNIDCMIGMASLEDHSLDCAAYKMGFDFYATEIDKDYFDAQENRFREECMNEINTANWKLIQGDLFKP